MTPLQQAQLIVGLDQLPPDAEQQIEALEAQAEEQGTGEAFLFPDIYEALYIRESSTELLEEK